jgi:desampylase
MVCTNVMNSLALPAVIRAKLRRRAERAGERECCGALLGDAASGRVTRVWPARNVAASGARAYRISAHQVRRIERMAELARLDVLGFYHSHPRGGDMPSLTDLAGAWPGYVYLIVPARGGFGRDEPSAWRLREDRSGFDRVALRRSAGDARR